MAEHRLGSALYGIPRDSYIISTKVGRILVPEAKGIEFKSAKESWAGGTKDYRVVFDYTAQGIVILSYTFFIHYSKLYYVTLIFDRF